MTPHDLAAEILKQYQHDTRQALTSAKMPAAVRRILADVRAYEIATERGAA